MDSICIAICLAILLSLLNLTKHFKNKKEKRNLPPSPPYSLPILGHLHLLKKPLHQSLARLSARYGQLLLLRLGTRSVLVVSSAKLANECLTTNDIAFANRPQFPSSDVISYNFTTFATILYGSRLRDMRRIAMAKLFSAPQLLHSSSLRTNEALLMARQLFHDASSGEAFSAIEMRPRLFGHAMNLMMVMMAGKRYYGEERGSDEAMRFMKIVKDSFAISGASNPGDFLPSAIGWLLRQKIKGRSERLQSYRDRFMQDLVDERRRQLTVQEDDGGVPMIDAILSLQKTFPHQYDDHFIKALVTSLLSAGTDTSSNLIEWAMSLLLNNPEKLTKLLEEIDEIVENGRLLNESDLPKLPYLNCVIKETLRICPVAPLLVPHESSEECEVGGYTIPAGTILLVNVYAIQRDPATWKDPTKFLPERYFYEANMIPFGIGRRKCLGEDLAMKWVGLVLGILVQCFEWRRVGLDEVDMEEGPGLTMPRANPLKAMCRPRKTMISFLSQL